MKVAQGKQPIFWLVRLLGAIGFVMAVVMIGQTGLQLRSIRTDRLRLEEQQEHLSQATREIIRRAEEAHGEIQVRPLGSGRITYQFDLIQDLKLALFGKGYADDDSHQRIVTGTGGLYTLRRDTLLLRRQREKLEDDLELVWHKVDAVVVVFGQTAQTILGRSPHRNTNLPKPSAKARTFC